MTKLIGNLDQCKVVILSAPAGTGKTTLFKKLVQEFPKYVIQSISCTTRPPRQGEIDGKDYIFLTKEAFEKRKNLGEFIEHATVFGYQYGTLKATLEKQKQLGKYVFLIIDTQGALALKDKIDALFVFVHPPSIKDLKNRLQNRETETKEMVKKRVDWAYYELEQSKYYDYQIINDDLEVAYQVLKSILIAEEHKI